MNHVVGLLAVGRQAKRARVNEKPACSKLGNLVPRSSRYSRRPWYTLRTTPRGMESFVTWNTWFSFSVHFFQDRIWLFTMFDPGKSVDEDEIKCFMSYSRVFSVPSFSISRRPWGRGWSMGIQRYFVHCCVSAPDNPSQIRGNDRGLYLLDIYYIYCFLISDECWWSIYFIYCRLKQDDWDHLSIFHNSFIRN